MKLLIELLNIITEEKKKKGVTSTARAKVYAADYEKTKDEAYRQYDPSERRKKRRRKD